MCVECIRDYKIETTPYFIGEITKKILGESVMRARNFTTTYAIHFNHGMRDETLYLTSISDWDYTGGKEKIVVRFPTNADPFPIMREIRWLCDQNHVTGRVGKQLEVDFFKMKKNIHYL